MDQLDCPGTLTFHLHPQVQLADVSRGNGLQAHLADDGQDELLGVPAMKNNLLAAEHALGRVKMVFHQTLIAPLPVLSSRFCSSSAQPNNSAGCPGCHRALCIAPAAEADLF